MSRPQFGQPILHDVSCVARMHCLAASEQVRMTSIAPPVDCGEVEVAGRRVCLWKSARQQIRQHRLEFGARFAEAAGGHLQRDIARLDVEAHSMSTVNSAYRSLLPARRALTLPRTRPAQ